MKAKNPFELTEAEKREQIEAMWQKYEHTNHIEKYCDDIELEVVIEDEDLD